MQAQHQPDLSPAIEAGAEATVETAAPSQGRRWAIEIFTGTGWVVRKSFLSGSIRTFDSYEQALEAAVSHWQKSDRPARPLWLGAADPDEDAPAPRH